MSMYLNEFVCISLFFHDHARLLVCACMRACVDLFVHMCSITSMWMHNCVRVYTIHYVANFVYKNEFFFMYK